jgi:hypothetical protein
MDKLKAIPGPWNDEPNREEFKHAGLDCLLLRGPMGAWCGYAAVKPGHKLYKKPYSEADVRVHGGITYAEECQGEICHETEEEDKVWWFGFDCAHAFDLVPLMPFKQDHSIYRDIAYVRDETKRLAEQLAAIQ